MGTEAQVMDQEKFSESIASVRRDTSDDVYMIVGHVENDPAQIEVIKVGQDVDEIVDNLDDSQVMYILARYASSFDMSTTVKFMFFRWHGEEVQFTKRGKFGVVFGSIKKLFEPWHMFVETGSREDFQSEKIAQQLDENTGMKSKVIESKAGYQERGFTSTTLPTRGPVAKTGPQISSAGAVIEVLEEVMEGIAMVRNDDNPATWTLAEYKDGNSKGPIIHTATGEGNIEELKEALKDNIPMYGLYRVKDIVDDIATVKFAYITWVGENVKPMMKAKMSTHKGTSEQTFYPFHVSMYANELSEITEDIINEKVTSASGSKSNVK